MPITCPVRLPRLSTEEFGTLDYRIMPHAFASHKQLGRLADEAIYQADLTQRLVSDGFDVISEVPITVSYRSFVKTYYLDLVVGERAIYELKAVKQLSAEHEAQLMNYLLLLGCAHGKLLNFRPKSVESRYVNAPLTEAQRRSFAVEDRQWRGDSVTKDWVIEILRDWGTALELPLYHQALVHLLGGDEAVIKLLPMQRGNLALGNQRFHLMDDDAAFRITAFNDSLVSYEAQIRKLLQHSPIKSMHWINIGHEVVTFQTI